MKPELKRNVEIDLSEDDRNFITHCLIVARDVFHNDAKSLAAVPGMLRLTEQFKEQEDNAQRLYERIENAEYVKLGKEVA